MPNETKVWDVETTYKSNLENIQKYIDNVSNVSFSICHWCPFSSNHISLCLNNIQLNECKLAIELNRAWKMEQTEQKQNRCIVFSQSKQLVFYALIWNFEPFSKQSKNYLVKKYSHNFRKTLTPLCKAIYEFAIKIFILILRFIVTRGGL